MRLNSKLIIITGVVVLVLLVVMLSSRASRGEPSLNDENLHFVSQRVPLTFQYPKDWPISPAEEKWEDGAYLDDKTVEAIDFSEEFIPNARSDSFGYILVTKIEINNVEEYLTELYTSEFNENLSVEEYTVGGEEGYRVRYDMNPKFGGTLDPKPEYTYYIYQGGLLYQIALTNPSYKDSNPDEIDKIFEDVILTSMKFAQ